MDWRRAAIQQARRRRASVAVIVLGSGAMLLAASRLGADDRSMAYPMVALAASVLVYVMTLWARDGALPVFETGTLCMLAIGAYGILPLAGFIFMDGQWDISTDNRLFAYPFDASELAMFGWRYVVYAASFALAYLLVRGKAAVQPSTRVRLPGATTQVAILAVFATLYAVKLFFKYAYGYDPEGMSYGNLAGYYAEMMSKPYLVRQLGHNVLGMLTAAHQAVLALLLLQWRKRWCRWTVVAWLAIELVTTAIRGGSRSATVLLLLAAAVLFHRLVRRLSFRVALVGGSLFLFAFLMAGAMRAGSTGRSLKSVLIGANEFQGLFTTAFDIYKRKELGSVEYVPWQLYVSDFVLVIPSQFLPFQKMDGSDWYIDLIGSTGRGIGYMFGVMSQGMIGLDWPEFVLRGVVLAVCLALLQRWYVRHASSYWPMLLCLFVSVYTYYTFRASTFYFVYFVVYRWVPFYLAASVLSALLDRVRGRARSAVVPA